MKFSLLLIQLLFAILLFSQNYNRITPKELAPYRFEIVDSNYSADYLLTPFDLTQQLNSSLVILDSSGNIKWYAISQFSRGFTNLKYHPAVDKFTFVGNRTYYVMDTSFTLVDSLKVANGFKVDSHEFELLPNGNYILSGASDSVVDLSNHVLNGVQASDTTHITGFTIQEFNPQKNIVFQWNSNDYINPLESYDSIYGYKINGFDYCHGNSIEVDSNGDFIVSMRHTNSLFKIRRATGQIVWRLGGKLSDFSFVNDFGFSGQHDARVTSSGTISLFDNGNGKINPVSRGVTYQLDTINWTATKVYEYYYPTGFYSRAMGNFQNMTNGDRLIGYGMLNRPHPSFVVVDAADTKIAELFLKDSIVSYRALKTNLPQSIKQPTAICHYQNGVLVLEAPLSNNYEWSTGDTTRSIVVNQTGEYQFYIPRGIGKVGSEIIRVSSISGYCNSTSLSENSRYYFDDKVIKQIDLLGRELLKPKRNQIVIHIYESGRVEKVIWNGE